MNLPLLKPLLLAVVMALAPALVARPCGAQSPAVPSAPEAAGATEESPSLAGRLTQATWDRLQGQSVLVGLGYAQGTVKFSTFRGDPAAIPQLTDNGRLDLLLQYETPERYFAEYTLRTGRAAFGYQFVGSYAGVATGRQITSNAFQGEDLGTAVAGRYVLGAPLVFVRLGPLYPDRAVFWKAGFGLGLGLVQLDGTLLPYNGEQSEAIVPVRTEGTASALAETFQWELEIDPWLVAFRSVLLFGKAAGDRFSYELYSLGVAYRVRF